MPCKRCGSETPQNALYCPFCGRRVNYTPKTKKRGNGQGTAFKRGSTWTAQVTSYTFVNEKGKLAKKYKTKGGFKTKKEALEFLPALRDLAKEEAGTTLSDYWAFYQAKSLPQLSASKQTSYKIAWKKWTPKRWRSRRATEASAEPSRDAVKIMRFEAAPATVRIIW